MKTNMKNLSGFLDCAVDDENLPAFYGQQTIIASEKSIYYWNISANKVDMRGSARYVFPENTKGCACVRFINDGQRVSAAGLEEVDSAIAELLQKNPKRTICVSEWNLKGRISK